jgi:hypothetical protein
MATKRSVTLARFAFVENMTEMSRAGIEQAGFPPALYYHVFPLALSPSNHVTLRIG